MWLFLHLQIVLNLVFVQSNRDLHPVVIRVQLEKRHHCASTEDTMKKY